MIKAILFDLDGVLADLCTVHFNAFNQALIDMGRLDISYLEHMEVFNGLPTRQKIKILNDRGMGIDQEEAKQIEALKQKYTLEEIENLDRDENLVSMLEVLTGYKYKIICVTNSIRNTVTTTLSNLGVIDYFDLIVSNEDVTKNKPDPEPYRFAINKLGLKVDEVLIIEDSPKGIESATSLGCHTLCIAGPQDLSADLILGTIDSLSY